MISPINFKGVQISSEVRPIIPKPRKKEPNGFYQVVNFLDSLDDKLDFRIKKATDGCARIFTYDKKGRKLAVTKNPIFIGEFMRDPAWVIGEVGMSIYSDKIGRIIFSDMFESSDKSASPEAAENAQTCNDYNDLMPLDYLGRFK